MKLTGDATGRKVLSSQLQYMSSTSSLVLQTYLSFYIVPGVSLQG